MPSDSDGMDHDAGGKRKPPKFNQDLQQENEDFYKPYYKLNYKRVFPESLGMADIRFLLSRKEGVKLGNTNPLMLAVIFKNEIKGVM